MSESVLRGMLDGVGRKVLRIVPIEGAKIEKNPKEGSFEVPVIYELEDGTTAQHYIWKPRKRDVKARLDALPCAPDFLTIVTVYDGKVQGVAFC